MRPSFGFVVPVYPAPPAQPNSPPAPIVGSPRPFLPDAAPLTPSPLGQGDETGGPFLPSEIFGPLADFADNVADSLADAFNRLVDWASENLPASMLPGSWRNTGDGTIINFDAFYSVTGGAFFEGSTSFTVCPNTGLGEGAWSGNGTSADFKTWYLDYPARSIKIEVKSGSAGGSCNVNASDNYRLAILGDVPWAPGQFVQGVVPYSGLVSKSGLFSGTTSGKAGITGISKGGTPVQPMGIPNTYPEFDRSIEPDFAPLVEPIQPQPAPAPLPQPEPLPEAEPLPSSPPPSAPPIAPPAVPGPGLIPAPVRVPGPGFLPAQPFSPLPLPSAPPGTPQLEPDGSVSPTPIPPPVQTPIGVIDFDGELIGGPAQQPAPTIEGIAQEVGRIERKLEIMRSDPRVPGDVTDQLGLLEQLWNLLGSAAGSGAYELFPVCDFDSEGSPAPPEVAAWTGSSNPIEDLAKRIDALALLIQHHKNLRQPTCRRGPTTGEPVTVLFEQVLPTDE
jgi:hypothetical protein